MPFAVISQQLRHVLEKRADALSLSELIARVDLCCAECATSQDLLVQFEEELQFVYHDLDHSSLYQIEVFLTVLYHISPAFSSTSIISNWWDMVLRPALRIPKLPLVAVNHAKELVNTALRISSEISADKVKGFRRHLLDLYLLDVYSECSGEDTLEWAALDQKERDERKHWKSNLEDILLRFGCEQPAEFLNEVDECFSTASFRLQLLLLLNIYTSHSAMPACASVFATHPIMSSLISSLLLDNLQITCAVGINILVKLLPMFAVHASSALKLMLPTMLAILSRMICWRTRLPANALLDSTDYVPIEVDATLDLDMTTRPLEIRPELKWQRLEPRFDALKAPAPVPNSLFCVLYYLFPCNLLLFLRKPAPYLMTQQVECPFVHAWESVIDDDELRSKSEPLLRAHTCHPSLIWSNADNELVLENHWSSYDLAQIVTECRLLDVRTSALALRSREDASSVQRAELAETAAAAAPSGKDISGPSEIGHSDEPTPVVRPIDLDAQPGSPRVSLQDMVAISVALRNDLDVKLDERPGRWPAILSSSPTPSSSSGQRSGHTPETGSTAVEAEPLPPRLALALDGLQKEVLMLRNELNFELWMSRENVKHIGRLYSVRILTQNAEVERQGLFNKLRKYRAQVVGLERELKEHKQQAAAARGKYAEYNNELHQKIHAFREEKKGWIMEAAVLRKKEKEAQALFQSQKALLEEASQELFMLQSQRKETQHKLDRLQDYERQIDQHIRIQRLWDADFQKFNAREEEIQTMVNERKKMQLRLESYEKTYAELHRTALNYNHQIHALELRLEESNKKAAGNSRRLDAAEIALFATEKSRLTEANQKLRETNSDLRDEVEELRQMVEVLKGQVSGKKGVIYETRSSPLVSPSLS